MKYRQAKKTWNNGRSGINESLIKKTVKKHKHLYTCIFIIDFISLYC